MLMHKLSFLKALEWFCEIFFLQYIARKMAGLVVESRFAGLQMEDEDYPSTSDGQKSKKTKSNASKKTEPAKKPAKPAVNKSQSVPKKKKAKQNNASANQWETWKQKDAELVDGNFEDELQQAILLSKLDFEEKKDVYKQLKKEAEIEKKMEATHTSTKKQKKKNVMSLDQFNEMVAGEEIKLNHEEESNLPEIKTEKPKDDTEFFERVKSETKNEILKEKINDRVKSRPNQDIITRLQFADALEKKDKEITDLREEVTNLKKELITVKSRNKKLCNILGQGEMKDKAEVLVEVERLRAVQTELTAEIASLHSDLEKERSRNADPRAKDKKNNTKKKSIRFDVSSEAISAKDSNTGAA